MNRTRLGAVLAAGLTAALAVPAEAHTYLPAAGAFTNGLIHPFLDPGPVTAIIALGAWLAGQERSRWSAGFAAFVASMAAGFLGAALNPLLPGGPYLLAAGALFAGALAALGRPQPRALALGIGACIGAGFGIAAHDPFLPLTAAIVSGFGTAIGGIFLLLNLVALGTILRRPWMRVGFRILGSWTAAIALLVLAGRLLR